MQPAKPFVYVSIVIASLTGGAIVGGTGGLLLGWLQMLSHHPRAPGHVDDAPVYVAIGLMQLGVFVGAIAGLGFGIFSSIKIARQRPLDRAT